MVCLRMPRFSYYLEKRSYNITDFVWNDIHQRELDVLYRNLREGVLNLQDSELKMSTFRIKWLCELLQSDPKSIECFFSKSAYW